MRAFKHCAKCSPWPASTATLIFNKHVLIFKAYFKAISKSGRLTVNNSGENIPEGNH